MRTPRTFPASLFAPSAPLAPLAALALITALTACTAQTGGTKSSLSISFPQGELKAASASSSYDFTRACFAVNVTAKDIGASSAAKCSIPLGVFGGFAAPGGTISLSIPRGSARKLEVFTYLRDSAALPCPVQTDFGAISANKLTRVGTVASFDALTDTVNLAVNLAAPASTDNLITQYSLAASCSAKEPAPSSAGFVNGFKHGTDNNGRTINVSVSGMRDSGVLAAGGYKIHLLRKPMN